MLSPDSHHFTSKLSNNIIYSWLLSTRCEAIVLHVKEGIIQEDFIMGLHPARAVWALTSTIMNTLPDCLSVLAITSNLTIIPLLTMTRNQDRIAQSSPSYHQSLKMQAVNTLLTTVVVITSMIISNHMIKSEQNYYIQLPQHLWRTYYCEIHPSKFSLTLWLLIHLAELDITPTT